MKKLDPVVKEKIIVVAGLMVTVIFVVGCMIALPMISSHQDDMQEAEALAFIQSLEGSTHYNQRVKDYYFGLSDESLIAIAGDYFPKQTGTPYTIGSEVKMVEILTGGKYTIKQGWTRKKIVRVK